MCVEIWQWRKSRDEKSRFFYAYHLHSLSSRSFTRSLKKPHSGGGFFWRGFLVVLRKLLSNFHRKFANLEKPRFLLASVNGPLITDCNVSGPPSPLTELDNPGPINLFVLIVIS